MGRDGSYFKQILREFPSKIWLTNGLYSLIKRDDAGGSA